MEEIHTFVDDTEIQKIEPPSDNIKNQVEKILPKKKRTKLLNTNYDDDECTLPGGSGQEEWENQWE